ncbi:MAG: tetratricopeptide repeat protein, partial [Planctomycetota bacterium]
ECTAAFERAMHSVGASVRARETLLADGVRVMREALERDDADPRVWIYLGELELQRGRSDVAVDAFRRAIELDPQDALAHSGFAYGLVEQHREVEAEEALHGALTSCPSALLRGQLGSLLIDQGRIEEAADQIERGLELEPENEELLLLHARHLSESEEQMRDSLERALASDPDFVDALVDLGVLFATQSRRDSARKCFRRAIDVDSDCVEAFHELAALELDTAPREALRLAGRSLEIDPEESRGWSLMGEALWQLGRKAEAHRALERACSIRPVRADGARAFWIRARLSEEEGLVQHAIWRLEEAAAYAHLWQPVAADLGRLYADVGRLTEAERWLQIALEHDVDDRGSRRLLRRLRVR